MTYVLVACLLIGVIVLLEALYYIPLIWDGKKQLAILRDPARWQWREGTNKDNAYLALSSLIYSLNLGGNLRPYNKTYARGWLLRSTPEELWRIHHQVHRWRIGELLEQLRNGEFMYSKIYLKHDLKQAGCKLEDLGLTWPEFSQLQKRVLLEAIRCKIQEYQNTGNGLYLLSLRPSFEDADMKPRVAFSEVESIMDEMKLDYIGRMGLEMASEGYTLETRKP